MFHEFHDQRSTGRKRRIDERACSELFMVEYCSYIPHCTPDSSIIDLCL